MSEGIPASVLRLRRAVASALLRARLDVSGPVVMANAFLGELRRARDLNAEAAAALWKESLAAAPAEHRFGLYQHFPYCRSRCLYCFTPSQALPGKEAAARYVEDALRETRFFAPLFRDREFDFWAVGGGTPSLLDLPGLRRWLEPAAKSFAFSRDGLRSVELNPASTSPAKLSLLKSLGFNRVSFGVQSLDPRVLRTVRREYQDFAMLRRVLLWARSAGFGNVSADLVLGLAGESSDGFLDGFRRLASLRPSMIVVSPLVLTDGYLRATGLNRDHHLRAAPALQEAVREGLRRAASESAYRPVQFDPGGSYWVFLASDISDMDYRDWESRSSDAGPPPRSTLALGWHGQSRLFGRGAYARRPGAFSPRRALYRLTRRTTKEEMAQHVLYVLDRCSRIDYAAFRRCFGREFRDSFQPELAVLRALGAVRGEAAACTFLPRTGPQRLLHSLFFLLDTLQESPFVGEEFRRLRLSAERDVIGGPA